MQRKTFPTLSQSWCAWPSHGSYQPGKFNLLNYQTVTAATRKSSHLRNLLILILYKYRKQWRYFSAVCVLDSPGHQLAMRSSSSQLTVITKFTAPGRQAVHGRRASHLYFNVMAIAVPCPRHPCLPLPTDPRDRGPQGAESTEPCFEFVRAARTPAPPPLGCACFNAAIVRAPPRILDDRQNAAASDSGDQSRDPGTGADGRGLAGARSGSPETCHPKE